MNLLAETRLASELWSLPGEPAVRPIVRGRASLA
jgi:hypothetical protein